MLRKNVQAKGTARAKALRQESAQRVHRSARRPVSWRQVDRGGDIRPERKPGPGHIGLRATGCGFILRKMGTIVHRVLSRSDVIQLQFSKNHSGFVWRMIYRDDSIRRQPARGGRCTKGLLLA